MSLTPEQIKEIKSQLIEQVNSSFPEDKKAQALSQIESMNEIQLEEFLSQNNLLKQEQSPQKCIFCSIVFGDIPSTKIGENSKAIAILELNPISKAHTLIIPKEHIESPEKLPPEVTELAKEISEKLNSIFQPKDILLKSQNILGHEIINLIPVYKNETADSPRKKSTTEELSKIKEQLENSKTKKEEAKEKEPQKEINDKNTWLPKRIP